LAVAVLGIAAPSNRHHNKHPIHTAGLAAPRGLLVSCASGKARFHGGCGVTAAQLGVVGGTRRRAVASRVSTGHVVMVIAGLLGALLTLSALRAADDSRPVLVAAHEILPGTVIDGGTLRVERIHADAGVLATLFAPTAIDDLRGRVAVTDVRAGSLLTQGDVQAAAAGTAPRAMSFPIPVARAVDGALRSGDRVDVLAVQHNTGRSNYVATDAQVLAFSTHGAGPLEDSQDASVTLAVDPGEAARIASALETGSVTLVRSTGAKRLHASAPNAPPAGATSAGPS
jgi:Flp pilus assembly protein CpaB